MKDHPSELALEEHLLEPSRSGLTAHLGQCERCRARVLRMEKEGEDFRRFVLPATLDAVVERHARRRRPWFVVLTVGPAVAAAAVLLVLHRGPGEEYVGAKGGLAFAIFTAGASGAEAVQDGGRVSPSAAVRFRVQPAGACRLWIASVDETGQISRIYPSSGEAGATVAQAGAVPGGAVLDGKEGLERFYAVCTQEPVTFSRIEASIRSTVEPGVESLRRSDSLRGLPRGSSQATLLVEKR